MLSADGSRDLLRGRVENALAAMGCPTPASVAALVVEILPELIDEAHTEETIGKRLVTNRASRYGHPRDNWRRIGQKWAATLDLPAPIPPEVVGVMMMDVKTSRLVASPFDPDSLDDLEGYAEAQRLLLTHLSEQEKVDRDR